jgi:hypothetical protein
MGNKNIDHDKCRVVTPTFRVSFEHVFKAQSPKGEDKKQFSVTMLFPKDTDMGPINRAILYAKIGQYGEDKTKWPKIASPIKDGDHEKYKDMEGYAGHYVIKAISPEDRPPQIVNQQLEDIIDQKEFYSGCYARANIYAFSWEYMKKHGVSFNLNHVQKVKNGKPFTSRKNAKEVFSPLSAGDDESITTEVETETEELDFT